MNRASEAMYLAEEAKTAWGRQDPKRLWTAIERLAHLADLAAALAAQPQVSPLQARAPLTEAQTQHLFDTHVGSPSERYPLGRDDFSHFATAIQRTCADAWGVTLSEGERSHD